MFDFFFFFSAGFDKTFGGGITDFFIFVGFTIGKRSQGERSWGRRKVRYSGVMPRCCRYYDYDYYFDINFNFNDS